MPLKTLRHTNHAGGNLFYLIITAIMQLNVILGYSKYSFTQTNKLHELREAYLDHPQQINTIIKAKTISSTKSFDILSYYQPAFICVCMLIEPRSNYMLCVNTSSSVRQFYVVRFGNKLGSYHSESAKGRIDGVGFPWANHTTELYQQGCQC